MNRLVVVGNGFDIAHGLPTRYSDFMQYLVSENELEFYKELEKYIPKEDLWNSFEEALGYLDYEQIQEDNSCYFLDYGDDNWRDSANHDFQYMIGEDLSFAANIPYYFRAWIERINTSVPSCVSPNVLNRNSLFLNFNYTDTLERVYAIPTTNILYIHGNALRGENLILGHHDNTLFQDKAIPAFNSAEEHGEYMESFEEDFRLQEARETIKEYFRKTYKDTISIIKMNGHFFHSLFATDEVFVLGHSLSPIDFDYFIEIRRFVSPSCKWYISYYSRDDFFKAQQFAKALELQSYQLITFADIR